MCLPVGTSSRPVLAYYVHDLSPYLLEFSGGIGLRWYGLSYLAAFVAGYFLFVRLAREGYSDLAPEKVGDFITGVALVGVVLGGRLGYMIFYGWQEFTANPLVFFKLWDGGMASHGGIIGVCLFAWGYGKWNRIPWRNLGDNLAVVAPLGLFFGRCANFINGELYGRVTSVPWAVQFPKELYDADAPRRTLELAVAAARKINPQWDTVPAVVENARFSPALREELGHILVPRHPSQIYEGMLEGLLLFALLWVLRTRFRLADGVLSGVFFIAYALLRIFGEMFREPDAPLTGLLTRGQFLSLFLIAIGAAFLLAARIAPAWAPKFRK